MVQSELHVIYRWPERPKLTWKKLTENDCSHQLTLKKGAHGAERHHPHQWASCTLMWMMPLHLNVNQNSYYDDDEANSRALTN